jgi:hypothetical protein
MDWAEIIKGVIQGFTQNAVKAGEKEALHYFYKMKKALFFFAVEIMLVFAGLALTLAGVVMLLGQIFPVHWIMLFLGLVILNIVLLTMKFK